MRPPAEAPVFHLLLADESGNPYLPEPLSIPDATVTGTGIPAPYDRYRDDVPGPWVLVVPEGDHGLEVERALQRLLSARREQRETAVWHAPPGADEAWLEEKLNELSGGAPNREYRTAYSEEKRSGGRPILLFAGESAGQASYERLPQLAERHHAIAGRLALDAPVGRVYTQYANKVVELERGGTTELRFSPQASLDDEDATTAAQTAMREALVGEIEQWYSGTNAVRLETEHTDCASATVEYLSGLGLSNQRHEKVPPGRLYNGERPLGNNHGTIWWIHAAFALGTQRIGAYRDLLKGDYSSGQNPHRRALIRLYEDLIERHPCVVSPYLLETLRQPTGPAAIIAPADLAWTTPGLEPNKPPMWLEMGIKGLLTGQTVGDTLRQMRGNFETLRQIPPPLYAMYNLTVNSLAILGDPAVRLPLATPPAVEPTADPPSVDLFAPQGVPAASGAADNARHDTGAYTGRFASGSLGAEGLPADEAPAATDEPPPAFTPFTPPEPLPLGCWSVLLGPELLEDEVRQAMEPLAALRSDGELILRRAPPRGANEAAWAEQLLPVYASDPTRILILGDFDAVPASLQVLLARTATVGRLPWNDPAELARYAARAARAEREPPVMDRHLIALFSAIGPDTDGISSVMERADAALDRREVRESLENHPHQVLESGAGVYLRLFEAAARPAVLLTASSASQDQAPGTLELLANTPLDDKQLVDRPFLPGGAWVMVADQSAAAATPDGAHTGPTALAALNNPNGPLAIIGHLGDWVTGPYTASRQLAELPTLAAVAMGAGRSCGEAVDLFLHEADRLREARDGQNEAAARELESWILLGDPALRVAPTPVRVNAPPKPISEFSTVNPSAPKPSSGRYTLPTLRDATRRVQEKLAELGLLSSPADGLFGPATAAAVRAFQERVELPATGELDPRTLARLMGELSPALEGLLGGARPGPGATPAAESARPSTDGHGAQAVAESSRPPTTPPPPSETQAVAESSPSGPPATPQSDTSTSEAVAPAVTESPPPPPPTIVQNIVNTVIHNHADARHESDDNKTTSNEVAEFHIDLNKVKLRTDKGTFVSQNLLPELAQQLKELETDPLAVGKLLFGAIINNRPPLNSAGQQVDPDKGSTLEGWTLLKQRERLAVQLRLEPEPELYEQRWELLTTDRGETLGVKRGWTLYRFDERSTELSTEGVALKLLVAICDHPDLGNSEAKNKHLRPLTQIDAKEQREKLEPSLKPLVDAGLAEVTWLNQDGVPLTFEALREALRGDFTAVHLFGHGVLLPSQGYRLVLGRAEDRSPFVTARELVEILDPKVRLLFLSTCNGAADEDLPEPEPEADAPQRARKLGGVARVLVGKVPAVIAAQGLLPEDAAGQFARVFYDALARSGDVAGAVTEARLTVNQSDSRKGLDSWGLFTLHLSTHNPKLFAFDHEKVARMPRLVLPKRDGSPAPEQIRAALNRAGLDGDRLATTFAQARAADDEPTLAQDRAKLRAQITASVDLNANALRDYVQRQDPPLSFDPLVYRQIAAALNAGKNIVLIGPPGTAKTTLAQYVCEYAASRGMCAGMLSSTATADWTTFDTIGGYVPTGKQTLRFRPGVFLRAIAEGRWLVLDEMNRAEIDKAIGELFTAIAGQGVDLPYEVGGAPVRLLPPSRKTLDGWDQGAGAGFDFVLHPNWRVIGTMNIYDRASLYAMSLALMRRFAFIEVSVPAPALYDSLIDGWGSKVPEATRGKLKGLLSPRSQLMQHRTLGPAIAKDMLRYIQERIDEGEQGESIDDHLCEALLLYGCSQLDGMDRDAAIAVYTELKSTLGESPRAEDVLSRLRSLYPGITADEWAPKRNGRKRRER